MVDLRGKGDVAISRFLKSYRDSGIGEMAQSHPGARGRGTLAIRIQVKIYQRKRPEAVLQQTKLLQDNGRRNL